MIEAEVIIPSLALQPFVHHYWIMKTNGTSLSQIIMPVGCLRWMFHRKTPFDVNGSSDISFNASVAGLNDKAIKISTTKDVEMITVFFLPYAAQVIMGIPCKEFSCDNVDFDQLEDIEFKDLKAKVLEAESTDKCIDLIEEFIIKRLLKAQGSNYIKQLSNAFQLMNAKPDVRVEELASEACLSERQFRRVFIDNVGMSPKQIQRIQRFHLATNEMLQSKVENIEQIVYKYGYTDHSHFNREFHEIAGMSPTEYLNSLESIRKHGIMPIYRSYHVSK